MIEINLKKFDPKVRNILSSHNLFLQNSIRKLDSPFTEFYRCYKCSFLFAVDHSNKVYMLDYLAVDLLTCDEAKKIKTIKDIIE